MPTGWLFVACLFYAIAFPKAGIKVYGVPITFGYALSAVMIVNVSLWTRHLQIAVDRAGLLFVGALLAFWSLVTLYSNGSEDYGYTIAYLVAVIYMPIFGLLVFSHVSLDERIGMVERTLRFAVRFVIAYGIFLFVYKTTTGRWIEIPYLTVNADDVGTLDDKFIDRGGIYKLISTYNNGNIFGVTMCILGPLYLRLERSRVWRFLFYAGLVLTLSRTVWIGLVLILTLRSFSSGVKVTTFIYGALSVLAVSIGLSIVLDALGRDMSFILDKDLGGRVDQLSAFTDAGFVSETPAKPLSEIVYTAILDNLGWIGLALFVAYLAMPSVILRNTGVALLSVARSSACLQGTTLYLVIAGSDAAFSFIPVMMVFWMIVGLGLWYRDWERAPLRLVDARPR